MMEMEGRVAVVTGAASGMGLGMARRFAASGMKVVLADIEQAPLDDATAQLADAGHEVLGVRTDVSSLDDVRALADATLDRFGAVHVLCNNAGVAFPGPVAATSIEDWRWTFAIDLWGPIYGINVFLPLIEAQGEGHINSTASLAGLYGPASLGAYNVAKHGVVGLMTSLERDLRRTESPIRASVLCPGPVNTNIAHSQRNRPAESAAEYVPTEQGDKLWRIMEEEMGEGMDPDDVGQLVLDAIVNEQFWIFTHDDMADQIVRVQTDAMINDRRLTR